MKKFFSTFDISESYVGALSVSRAYTDTTVKSLYNSHKVWDIIIDVHFQNKKAKPVLWKRLATAASSANPSQSSRPYQSHRTYSSRVIWRTDNTPGIFTKRTHNDSSEPHTRTRRAAGQRPTSGFEIGNEGAQLFFRAEHLRSNGTRGVRYVRNEVGSGETAESARFDGKKCWPTIQSKRWRSHVSE